MVFSDGDWAEKASANQALPARDTRSMISLVVGSRPVCFLE